MLPADWRLAPDPATVRRDDGRVLLGGTPFRAWRVDDRGARLLDELLAGHPIGDSAAAQGLARRLLDAGMAQPRPGATERRTAEVTVVVPFLGPPVELAATLAALGPVGAVVVVDDAGPDPAAIAAVARDHGAEVVRHPTNRGPAAARNTGWRRAATDLVAFVDGGCRPEPGWLPVLLAHLDDDRVAAVAPRIATEPAPSLPPLLAAYEDARPSLDRGSAAASVRPGSRVPFVPSAALLVRRADLEAVGGFDEALRFGEDVDLVWRLVATDRTVRYVPAAQVRHVSRPSARTWLRQRFDYGTSAAALAVRHDEAVRPLGAAAPVAAAWALGAGVGVVPGMACAALTTARLVPKLSAVPDARREAVRLSIQGHRYGGLALVDALRRPWWPLLLGAAVASRRARRVAALVVVAPPLAELVRERLPIDPARWIGLRLADDVAYGTGVWAGAWRARSVRCLLPVLRRDR